MACSLVDLQAIGLFTAEGRCQPLLLRPSSFAPCFCDRPPFGCWTPSASQPAGSKTVQAATAAASSRVRVFDEVVAAVWRPAQLAVAVACGGVVPRKELERLYLQDVRSSNLVTGPVPPRPGNRGLLRVVQWNVNAFSFSGGSSRPQGELMAQLLLGLDADVLVLQEWTRRWRRRKREFLIAEQCLRDVGFKLLTEDADTALMTRCEVLGATRHFGLDALRTASRLCVRLACGTAVAVYGTHLHHKDGDGCRLHEAEVLLADVGFLEEIPTLVVADWNQPRKRDYSPEEWAAIAQSARLRGEPEDDGVCSLLEARGFDCSLDRSGGCRRNWPTGALPPSTHWSGTAVDYSFARGLCLHGTYVLPSMLSDHFPVVSDWMLPETAH